MIDKYHKQRCINCQQAEQNGASQLFCKDNVYVHPQGPASEGIRGFMSILYQPSAAEECDSGEIIVTWIPHYMLSPSEDDGMPTFVNIAGSSTTEQPAADNSTCIFVNASDSTTELYTICIPLLELKSIRRHIPSLLGFTAPHVILQSKGGVAFPPLYFHSGGVRELFATLSRYCHLSKDENQPNLFYVNDDTTALGRSLQSLQIIDKSPSTRHGIGNLFGNITRVSKVARAGWHWLQDGTVYSPTAAQPAETEPCEKLHSTVIGDFEIVEHPDTLSSQSAELGQPLNSTLWGQAFDSEGRIRNFREIKRIVFEGGVQMGIRIEVWKFLLGYMPPSATYEERALLRKQKREEYYQYKSQWSSITSEQAKHFTKFVERNHMIEKDVVRTDRALSYFEEDDNPRLKLLHDILLTYSFFNFDLGYVQGMNDLLAPILVIMEDEADSFWCFKYLMDRMAPNFHKDQNGMHTQLLQLSNLLQYLDPTFYRFLEKHDCLNFFYCYRWILIQFKREFEFDEIMTIWEVIWSDYLTPQFHLFIAVGILLKYRETIMNTICEFDELLRFVNSLAGSLNVAEVLHLGQSMFQKFLKVTSSEEERTSHTGIVESSKTN